MKTDVDDIAKKYAQAYFNMYAHLLDQRCVDVLIDLDNFFKENRRIFLYLSIPTIAENVKEHVLNELFRVFNICDNIKAIVYLLLRHKRIELFSDVVYHAVRLFRLSKNVQLFNIFTSHVLLEQEKAEIISFLKRITGFSIVAEFIIDKRLISGIRIRGDYIMWEHSLARLLRDVEQDVLQQVRSW